MENYTDFVDDVLFEQQIKKALAQVENPEHGFFGPDSVLWQVMKKIFPLYMASSRLLIMQSIHIWMAQAGKDSYAFSQPMNRAYRTYVSVSIIIFGTVEESLTVARFIRKMHQHVEGELETEQHPFPDQHYQANEGHALLWVHAALWESIVSNYNALNKPLGEDQLNQLNQELKIFAYLFGIEDHLLPDSWAEFMAYNQKMWKSSVLGFEQSHEDMVNYFLTELAATMPRIYKPFFDFHREYTISTLPENIRNTFKLTYNRKSARYFLELFRWVNRFLIPAGYNEYYVKAMGRIKKRSLWRLMSSKIFSHIFLTATVWRIRKGEGSRFRMPELKDGKIV